MQELVASGTRDEAMELKELQNNQHNLLMLQQKRNELEKLRTLLQAALESGDMETLGQLSELIQEMPDVTDVSESLQETGLVSLCQKQATQKANLASLEKEQDHLSKCAQEHREALALKRGQLEDLQQKLSEIKTNPWTATEEQLTVVHPDGLDRKVSASTLIDDSAQENDEALDAQMEENELYLQEQEKSLTELRQRIEMLQQLKKELENQNAAAENGANSQEMTDDSDETLESLLRKLASASIEDIKAADFGTGDNHTTAPLLVGEDEVKEDEEHVFDDAGADVQIRESILQAEKHVKDLEHAIATSNTPEEKKVYMDLHEKLSQQLAELVEVEAKLTYYRSMMKASQEENSPVMQELPEVVIQPEVKIPIETAVIDVPRAQTVSHKATKDSSFIHHAQIESIMNSKRSVSHAWSEVSKSTKGTHSYDSPAFQNGPGAWTAKRPGSAALPRRIISGESRRPTSSMAGEGSWRSDSSVSKSKRLFDSMKTDIYRHTSSMITKFENEPYFLLSFLKKINKIDSSYLKQKLLMTLDNLLEEEELEAQSPESFDDSSVVIKATPDAMNTDFEIMMKSRISEFLASMARDSSNQILNAIQLSKLNHFVLSLVHNNLYSTIDMNLEGSENLQDRLTILIDLLKPALDNETEVFQGSRLLHVQAELLSVIFQETHNVCEDWARYMESYDRFARWEHFSKLE